MDEELAKCIVEEIESDIYERNELDHVWDSMDDETKEEIRARWIEIIMDNS